MSTKNKHKLLTSNFTLEEQNNNILKEIKKENYKTKEFSFLNNNLKGIKNSYLGLYESQENQFEKIKLPEIIISSYFLKEIFKMFQENNLNRNILIEIKEKDLEITDLLYNKKKTIKTDIFLNKKNSFFINSSFFYNLKLNLKTINKKSIIYIFEDFIIYENNRNNKKFFYTLKTGEINE